MKKALNKILSLLLTVCLLVGMIPLTGAAAQSGCTHSCQAVDDHLADCSYVEGAECRHVHDEYCEWENITESEATQSDATRADAEQIVCNHFCDDDCGYIEAVACDHVCDENCDELTVDGSGKSAAVTILIDEDEYGDPTALYLTEGVAVTEADLLAGVTAVDENGEAVTVTVKDVGGLNMQNPAIPDGPPFPAIPYTITYQAAHPGDAEVTATVTREAYVTPGITGIQPTAAAVSINLASPGTPGAGDGWEIDNGNTIWIKDPDNTYTITGDAGGSYRVYVGGGTPATGTFDITLDGVTINAISLNGAAFAIESGCTVNLTITGTNTLASAAAGFAGLRSAEGTTLTIGGAGSLTANSGLGSAGIGGNAASIGSNDNCNGGIITINGGTVIANGASGGAGIGGGASGGAFPGGDGGTVTINGGTVTATGGSGTGGGNCGGAGIGGGGGSGYGGGSGGTVIINGGTVTATGGDGYVSDGGINGGAGIGGGGGTNQGGAAGIITINGGTVNANGGSGGGSGNNGADIGAGGDSSGTGADATLHIITASAGTGGSISPSGSVQVSEGADATFTITPDSGYVIHQVLVDNNNDAAAVSSGTYTFTNVTGNHTIAAVFIATPSLTLSASPTSTQTYPGNVTLTATLTGAAGGNSGKTITFTRSSGSSQTATTDANGEATYTVTGLTPGTYSFGASFAGDANNSAANAAQITGYTVDLGAQAALSITGLGNSYTYGNATFDLSTSGGSGGGAVSYISSNPGVVSVSGNTVTIHKAGTFTITATKAADSEYAAASVTSGTVTVSAATPNVSLDATGGSNITAPIVLTATVSKVGTGAIPTGTVTFSEGVTTLAANVALDVSGVAAYTVNNPTAGSHTYTATYNGQTDYYNTNNANRTIGVGLADQSALSITGNPATITYGDNGFTLSTGGGSGDGAATFSAPANNVLTVTSGGAVTITGAGTATVTATKAADNNYNQATATLNITVEPRDISGVTVSVTGDRIYTGSQLQPVFTVSDGTIAITSGDYTNTYGTNIDAGTEVGNVTLNGQGNYTGTKTVTFDIEKRSLTGASITLAAGPHIYTDSAVTPAVTSIVTGGITVPASEYDVSYANNASVGTATATVTAKAASTNFMGSESTAFIINAPTTYGLTINAGTGGSITAGTGGSYAQGDVINIAAGANRYYRFNGWTSSNGGSFGDADSAGTTFTMPGNATTITANFTYTGGSSSSDDSDSYSYTPATTYLVTVMTTPGYPSTARTTLTTLPDENNALAFTITKDMVQQALDKAKEEAERQGHESYGYALEFNFTTIADIDSLNITFNADALALLESAGIKDTAITTNSFRFRLDLAAIMEINRQSGGKAVMVSAARFSNLSDEVRAYIGSRPAWDITVSYKNGDKTENISNFSKGLITLGMRYTPASNEITDNLAVVYVPGSGNPQILTNSSYDNGWMVWQRSDLAVCGVGYISPDTAFTDTANH